MIIFLSCSKTKNDKKCKAKEMYTSPLFKKSYAYAIKLKPIYILSAKYDFLEPDDVIYPYDLTLKNMTKHKRKLWACKVYKQLQNKNCNFNDTGIFLCGKNYRSYLMILFPNSKCPIEGLSLGNILKFYNKELNK